MSKNGTGSKGNGQIPDRHTGHQVTREMDRYHTDIWASGNMMASNRQETSGQTQENSIFRYRRWQIPRSWHNDDKYSSKKPQRMGRS